MNTADKIIDLTNALYLDEKDAGLSYPAAFVDACNILREYDILQAVCDKLGMVETELRKQDDLSYNWHETLCYKLDEVLKDVV